MNLKGYNNSFFKQSEVIALGYQDFELKNGQTVYQVLGENLFEII